MRPLTKSEKRLLALCLLTIFVVGNLFFFQRYLQSYRADTKEANRIQGELKANAVWIADSQTWEEHRTWVDQNLPTLESPGQAGGQLLEELQKAASDNRFEIEKQSLLEPRQLPQYQTVAASVTLEGDLANLTQWLSGLQAPGRFYNIRNLRFQQDTKSKKETPQGICQVTIEKWFKPASP